MKRVNILKSYHSLAIDLLKSKIFHGSRIYEYYDFPEIGNILSRIITIEEKGQ